MNGIKAVKIEALPGDEFKNLCDLAKVMSTVKKTPHYFEFNGIQVNVDAKSDVALLSRDYQTALLLGWDCIGPTSLADYSDQTKAEIGKALESQELRRKLKENARLDMASEAQSIVDESKNRFQFHIWKSLRPEYDNWVAAQNGDSYGLAVFRWAETTATVALTLADDFDTHIGAYLEDAFHIADQALGGCTGFQYRAAKQILERYWLYGDIVKRVL